MCLKIPNQFPVEEEDVILCFDNQTCIRFDRNREYIKNPIELEQHVIMIILKGAKEMISTGEDITVHKNEVLFLEKGTYLASEKFLEDGQFSSILFFITDHFLDQFQLKHDQYIQHIEKNKEAYSSKMFKVATNSALEVYVQSLLPYFDKKQNVVQPILCLKIEELLLNLLFLDPQKHFNHYLSSLGRSNTLQFKETIEQSVVKNLTIEERAFLSNLSVSSFKRKFKDVFKETPARWLRQQRLKRAKILINTTDKSISEIAFEVGFESPSHFIHIFKKQYGMTPKQILN